MYVNKKLYITGAVMRELYHINPNEIVDQERLIKALEKFIAETVKLPRNVDAKDLAKDVADTLQNISTKSGEKLTVGKLADNKFLDKLSTTIQVTATLKSDPMLASKSAAIMQILTTAGDKDPQNAKLKFDKFRADVDKLLKDPNRKDFDKKFKNLLTAYAGAENIKKLGSKINELTADLKPKLDKNYKDASHKIEGMKESSQPSHQENYLRALLGVMSSASAGSHPVPTQQDLGNAIAIPDMNPYHGYASIDQGNKVDFTLGDSMGMESRAESRLESLGTGMMEAMAGAGLAETQTPTARAKLGGESIADIQTESAPEPSNSNKITPLKTKPDPGTT